MSNGEDLVFDWRFNVVDEPTEWAFDWDYVGESGTSHPTPRHHHATMYLIMNNGCSNDDSGADKVLVLRNFFKLFEKKYSIKLIVKEDKEKNVYNLKLKKKAKVTRNYYNNNSSDTTADHNVLLEGTMEKQNDEKYDCDPNVGQYVTFQSTTEAGMTWIKTFINNEKEREGFHGFQTVIRHERIEKQLKKGFRLITVTGCGPDVDDDDGTSSSDCDDDDHGGLATRFTLFEKEEEVARCHLTYKDGSLDPSMGPTIEMIAVKQSRRGEGLAKVLWYWVRCYIEENFTIESLNTDTPPGYVMVKATQLNTNEVETRQDETTNNTNNNSSSMIPVGFKEFIYDYCGFSVREQKGVLSYMLDGRRPKDEEAIKYIKLLPIEELSPTIRTHDSLLKRMPKIGRGHHMREKSCKRICMFCSRIGAPGTDLFRCNSCSVAFYCGAHCQKEDWDRHKKWCGKSREKIKKKLINEGLMLEDGRLLFD